VGRVLLGGKGIVDPQKERVILRTGDWAEIEIFEKIGLSLNVAGSFGGISSITRRGIVWFGGPHIDPGFKGKMFVSIFNPTSEPFEIEPLMRFFTIVFHDLRKKPSEGYKGKYQDRYDFPEEDVVRMMKITGPTLADVVRSVSFLEERVKQLTKEKTKMVQDLSWIKRLIFGMFIAIIVGLAVVVVGKLV
jgi:dCTP deaminase